MKWSSIKAAVWTKNERVHYIALADIKATFVFHPEIFGQIM